MPPKKDQKNKKRVAGDIEGNRKGDGRPMKKAKSKINVPSHEDLEGRALGAESDAVQIRIELKKHLLGTFRVAASSLDFEWRGTDNTQQRSVDKKHVNSMIKVFQEMGCQRVVPEHHIAALIDLKTFAEATKQTTDLLGINPIDPKYQRAYSENQSAVLPDLAKSADTDADGYTDIDRTMNEIFGYPRLLLPTGVTMEAQSGQHRIHAVREFFKNEKDKWWVVQLYDTALPSRAKEQLRFNGQALHKVPTLAECWHNMLIYKENNNERMFQATLSSLGGSTGKISQLLGYKQYREPLSSVLENKALWFQFTAGHLSRLLPMRCTDENVRYILRIKKIWDFIGEGIRDFYELLDSSTVVHVQGLSPGRFVDDARTVTRLVDNGTLFFKITQTDQRAVLRKRLLEIDYRILTLTTFWDDTKSMELFGRVMHDVAFWFDAGYANAQKSGTSSTWSIAHVMKEVAFCPRLCYPDTSPYPQLCFDPNTNTFIPMKKRMPDNQYCNFSYTTIWLFVIRNFFQLFKVYNMPSFIKATGVEPLSWVPIKNVRGHGAMTADEITEYNKRFSVTAWRSLYELCTKLGFYPGFAISLNIGPSKCEQPSEDSGMGVAERAGYHDAEKLAYTIRTLRPSMSVDLSWSTAKEFVAKLPPRNSDELKQIGEISPRTTNEMRRFGRFDSVWLPGFHDCHMKIDQRTLARTSVSKRSISDDEKDTDLSWFVKRDFLWSFLKTFADASPIFASRAEDWPPVEDGHECLKGQGSAKVYLEEDNDSLFLEGLDNGLDDHAEPEASNFTTREMTDCVDNNQGGCNVSQTQAQAQNEATFTALDDQNMSDASICSASTNHTRDDITSGPLKTCLALEIGAKDKLPLEQAAQAAEVTEGFSQGFDKNFRAPAKSDTSSTSPLNVPSSPLLEPTRAVGSGRAQTRQPVHTPHTPIDGGPNSTNASLAGTSGIGNTTRTQMLKEPGRKRSFELEEPLNSPRDLSKRTRAGADDIRGDAQGKKRVSAKIPKVRRIDNGASRPITPSTNRLAASARKATTGPPTSGNKSPDCIQPQYSYEDLFGESSKAGEMRKRKRKMPEYEWMREDEDMADEAE